MGLLASQVGSLLQGCAQKRRVNHSFFEKTQVNRSFFEKNLNLWLTPLNTVYKCNVFDRVFLSAKDGFFAVWARERSIRIVLDVPELGILRYCFS